MKPFALFFFSLFTLPLLALTEVVDGIEWTYSVSRSSGRDYADLTAIPSTTSGAVIIPSKLGGLPVEMISTYAFEECSSITSITIPKSVRQIGHGAFQRCTSLTSVSFSNGGAYAPSLGEYLFAGCEALISVDFPNYVSYIPDYAFLNCRSLESVTLPDSVTKIGKAAFSECSSLVSLEIPKNVTEIGSGAFYGCSSLKEIEVPEGVRTIESSTFYGCSLEKLVIPSTVTEIKSQAIYQCGNYEGEFEFVFLPSKDGVYIEEMGVDGLYPTSITGYWMPETVQLDRVISVGIPDGVTTLQEGWANDLFVYSRPSDIDTLKIPESLQNVDYEAFNNFPGLIRRLITTHVPSYSGDLMKYVTEIIIPEGTTDLPYYAFSGVGSVTKLSIPEGIQSFDNAVFAGFSSLESISIPASVKTIYSRNGRVFPTGNLKEILLAPGNQNFVVENGILYNKDKTRVVAAPSKANLGNVVLPDSVNTIDCGAFKQCESLTSILIPNGVTNLESEVFAGCTALSSVTLPTELNVIGLYAFQGCTSLKSIKLPDAVHEIPYYAFEGCTALSFVILPAELEIIEESAFRGCSSLKEIALPIGVTQIGASAFSGCTALKQISIPENVMSIGRDAFAETFGCQYIFAGRLPSGLLESGMGWTEKVSYSPEYAGEWEYVLSQLKRQEDVSFKAYVTVKGEMITPKIMQITYSIRSNLKKVNVRAIAFKDGIRSFSNVIPIQSGEQIPQGNIVETGKEYSFIWDISKDWDTDLDKVAMEILVQGETLLPQKLITIPAVDNRPKMTVSTNTYTSNQLFNALLWCYAEGDPQLKVDAGRVSVNGVDIAKDDKLPGSERWDGSYNSYWRNEATALLNYLYGKMGYKVLAGEDLDYAEAATRLDFADESNYPLRQVSVKIEEE